MTPSEPLLTDAEEGVGSRIDIHGMGAARAILPNIITFIRSSRKSKSDVIFAVLSGLRPTHTAIQTGRIFMHVSERAQKCMIMHKGRVAYRPSSLSLISSLAGT